MRVVGGRHNDPQPKAYRQAWSSFSPAFPLTNEDIPEASIPPRIGKRFSYSQGEPDCLSVSQQSLGDALQGQ